MPNPSEYEDEKSWMEACVPKRMDEGDAQDQAVAVCMTMWKEKKSIDADSLIAYGDAVKALGGGKVGGYLVRFSTANDPDMTGDYFGAETDFGGALDSLAWMHHRQTLSKNGKKFTRIEPFTNRATLTQDELGIFSELVLDLHDVYERQVYKLAEKKKLGWSSGTAAHLIERETGKAQHITRWPLGLDASLTPTPAEPRNTVMPIKSLTPQAIVLDEAEAEQENRDADKVAMPAHQTPTETIKELKKMDEPTKVDTAMADEVKALSAEVKALKEVIESAPVVSALKAGHVEVVKDPADIPFASLGAQFAAVKAFTVSNSRTIAPRLQYLTSIKAPLGGNESTPSEGGFLIDPTLSAELLMPLHETGPFVPAARKLPVGNNSNYGWINGVNETDRTSRWGGIVGYRLAEAGTKVASQPKFRRINWELKKYAVLIYGTDELLADAAQFSAVVRMGAAEELAFMANDDVLNGAGAAGPLGILSSGAVVSQAKETNQAAATIKYENLIKMWARLLPRSKANAKWFVNSDCSQQLDQLSFAVGTAALQPNFVSYNDEGVMSIKGKPVIETEFNATLGTEGDIVLADMSEYLFWEKGGVQEASSIHVAFLTDETVFRLVYRCDGQPSMAAPMTPYKGSVTQGAFVSLAVRA